MSDAASGYDVRMIILSTDDLDESIRFYTETLGMKLKFRDGAHYAAIDGGSVTLALPGPVFAGLAVCSHEPGVVETAMQRQIRAASRADFPSVDRFVALHEKQQTQPARPSRS